VCRTCGTTVEVQGGQVEKWTAEIASAHGFSDVSHTIEIFGLCAECAKTESSRG
jgi:Fur family ferric uptake transcriptional regulator